MYKINFRGVSLCVLIYANAGLLKVNDITTTDGKIAQNDMATLS